MKKNKKKEYGFTLVELLATIAILSLVVGLVSYVAINVINNARENSYKTTINEIEKIAVNYLSENNDRLFFVLKKDDVNVEYQCVSIDELVENGYFKNDILESKVSDDKKVSLDDYVYIERNSSTKTVTKSSYLLDENVGLCGSSINASGQVIIVETPSGYSKYKEITLRYTLKNYYNSEDYSYSYLFSGGDVEVISDDGDVKKIKVTDNGTITGYIKDKNGSVVAVGSKEITNIDNTPPVITIETNANTDYVKDINSKITVNDTGSGGDTKTYMYIYSTSDSDTANISFSSGNSYTLSEQTGIYYLIVEACDVLGNCTKEVSDKLYIDNTPPVININGDLTKVYGSSFDLYEGVTITDNSGMIDSKKTYLGSNEITSYTGLSVGANTVTYKVKDEAGNEASASRKITTVLADKEFNYKESQQSYQVKADGTYIIEAYGAQGGNSGGKGGYVKAEVTLKSGETIYINIGGVNGYNGGGGYGNSKYYPGGGATTVKYNGSNIVIAAGGGAKGNSGTGGAGGSGSGAGGASVGSGAGVSGTNGGGGSSSPDYSYQSCGSCCGKCTYTYGCYQVCAHQGNAGSVNGTRCWYEGCVTTTGWNCFYCGAYKCNCSWNTSKGKSGTGGSNKVNSPSVSISNQSGVRSGNGYVKVSYKVVN